MLLVRECNFFFKAIRRINKTPYVGYNFRHKSKHNLSPNVRFYLSDMLFLILVSYNSPGILSKILTFNINADLSNT